MNKENLRANYLVLFVDLLGQTNKLKKYSLMPEYEDDAFAKWSQETFGHVHMFRSNFEKALEKGRDDGKVYRQFLQQEDEDITVTAVSDSIIVFTPIHDSPERMSVLDVRKIFEAARNTLLYFLSEGIPFRGAIEIGIGLFSKDFSLYGPAIQRSYELESQKAEFPRIVVGTDLLKYLYSVSIDDIARDDHTQDLKRKIENQVAKDILQQVVDCGDGIPMVDIASDALILQYGKDLSIDMLKRATIAADKCCSEFEGKDEKLFLRYRRLLGYLSEKMRQLTSSSIR